MLCPRIRAKMPQGETCQLETHLVNKMVTSWNIPGVNTPGEHWSTKGNKANYAQRVNILCYSWDRVHRWNDVPLIDVPRATSPRSIWSTMGLHRHGRAQYLCITLMICHRSQVRQVCTIGQYSQNWLLISSEQWTAQTTNLLSSYFRRICAGIRWRTQTVLCNHLLIQTDSFAQPRKLLCFKVFTMYSQCKVFSTFEL